MNKQPENIRRLTPIVLTQAVGLLCGVAGIKITSHWIAPADYGAYGVFLTLAPLGITVVHAGLLKYVARHWAASEDRRGLLRNVYAAAAKKLPLLALFALAAVWLAPGLNAAGAWWGTWLLLFAGATLFSAGLIAQTALQADREHWLDFFASAASSVTRSFGPPLLYALAGGTVLLLECGFVVHVCVLAAAAAWAVRNVLRRNQKVNAPESAPARLGVYDGPLFIVLAMAVWILTAVNRWIVAGFFGSDEAGFFTLAGNISVIVTSMLGVVFVQYWQPVFFAMPSGVREERRALANRVDIIALAYTFCGMAGIGFLHTVTPWLTGILIDAKYTGALAMIAPAGSFGVAIVAGQFSHMMLLAAKKEHACLAPDLGGAFVLVAGGIAAAVLGGEAWFMRWLLLTPAIPWIVNRTLARRALFRE